MNTQVCTFMLGETLFGVDVSAVQEVLRPQAMTLVPLAPPVVRGLINLRGQIITAIDLRERLGFPPAVTTVPGMNLVVRLPDEILSFLVDDVGEVMNLSEDQFEDTPVTLQGAISDVITGVYKLKDRLLLLLNVTAAAKLPAESN